MIASLLISFTALAIYFVVIRIAAWRRLRHIQGPPLAGWTRLWLLWYQALGQLNRGLEIATHERHASPAFRAQLHYDKKLQTTGLFRVAPNIIVCNDAAEIRRIWSAKSGFRRSPWFTTARLDPRRESVLSMTDNKVHQQRRSKLSTGYAARGIDNLEQVMDEQVLKLVGLIDRNYTYTGTELRAMDLAQVMKYFTHDVISVVAFGRSFGYLDSNEDTWGVIEIMKESTPPIIIMGLFPSIFSALSSSPLTKPLEPKPTDGRGIGVVLGMIRHQVEKRYGQGKVRNNDMLQLLVDSGLPQRDVEAECFTQLVGGTSTISTAIIFTIFYVSTNAGACRKLQQEIDQAIAEAAPRPVVSDEQAKALPYLQAVIKESLRLWPPVASLLPRRSSKDEVICGVQVPAETDVAWDPFSMMKNKQIFGEDAAVFNPDRWLEVDPERYREMERAYSLVFATGSRAECLGKKLACIELGKVIFELFRHFDFTMVNPIEPFQAKQYGDTIVSGMNAKVTKRCKS